MNKTGAGPILVINAGSSSIKYALFDAQLTRLASGQAGGIGGQSYLVRDARRHSVKIADHSAALDAILADLARRNVTLDQLSACAHRVVHGGADLSTPALINGKILTQIKDCAPLAPLHNPHNIRAIETITALAPKLTQYASFDTGFHATNPDVAIRYAIPDELHKSNIRRFGFHGISYQALTSSFSRVTGMSLPEKLLAFHLGNGASICAIHNGRSVATTMGYSPLEGLTMGTRAGGIDAAAVLRMVRESNVDAVLDTLNRRSGLFALSGGIADMAELEKTDTPAARFAIQHFCYWAARHAGSLIAAMGGVDAFAFTGGIGENSAPVRKTILQHLNWTGVPAASTHIIAADEERQIAENALFLM